ncbi:heat-inducible transcriptional repressor HrcA [Actinomyces vulturis]|uniref:heat-inducible transcriptional repressor HrcA n=1 Tax=Actinomyces vulturis TaxID=1857645 RepID=UPI000832A1DE|nr:heat-inducible transcriptional repressor HrcA [Actinomyces vulturis]
MSNERRKKVLQAIVSDYVRTREPVGSRAIVERYRLGVSPATIRNDMAALEDEGLIHQPHTSAGRVPTHKGYRMFVDDIDSIKPLSPAERTAITAFLDGAVDLEDVVERTVRALAQLTGQLAVIELPSLRSTALRHLELVPMGPTRLLMVIITDTGRVEQRTMTVAAPIDAVALESVKGRLNAALGGRPSADVESTLSLLATHAPMSERLILAAVAEALADALRPDAEERLVMAGTANLARSTPDFSSLGPLLDAIEEQVVLMRLFTQVGDGALNVTIGQENNDDALAEASVVASSYGSRPCDSSAAVSTGLAHVGVVGPTRMDYPATMAAVRAVAMYLSRFLSDEGQQ